MGSARAGRCSRRRARRRPSVFVIIEGEAHGVRDGLRIARTLGTGDFFGEMALLDGDGRTGTVVAETDCSDGLRAVPGGVPLLGTGWLPPSPGRSRLRPERAAERQADEMIAATPAVTRSDSPGSTFCRCPSMGFDLERFPDHLRLRVRRRSCHHPPWLPTRRGPPHRAAEELGSARRCARPRAEQGKGEATHHDRADELSRHAGSWGASRRDASSSQGQATWGRR